MKSKINFKRFLVFCVISGTLILNGFAQTNDTVTLRGGISLRSLFDLEENSFSLSFAGDLVGSTYRVKVSTDFLITGNNNYNTLLYEMVGTHPMMFGISFSPTVYNNPNILGTIGEFYPHPWTSNDIKSSALAAYRYYIANDWRMRTNNNANSIFYDLFATIPVKIEFIGNADNIIRNCTLPGVGQVYIDDIVNKGLKFDPAHEAHSQIDSITNEWYKMKTISNDATIDLNISAHRGFWGNNLGTGPIENSDESIVAAKQYTKSIEADVTMTQDSVVVVAHDYNLDRLTDYTGSPNNFIYNLNYSEIQNLNLRKRDNTIVDGKKLITLTDLISYIKDNNVILTLDVKEKIKRTNPTTGICDILCDLTQSERDKHWCSIVSKIIETVGAMDAWKYVAIKSHHPTLNTIKKYLPSHQYADLHKLQFFPVIQPGRTRNYTLNFIDDWYNNGTNLIVGYETNFKSEKDTLLMPFSNNGKAYANFLQYIMEETELRPGIYAEEPGGAKGTVDRYGQWKMKDVSEDFRGDPFWLMNIAHFNKAIITSDRPDIWKQIKNLYNPNSAQLASANNFVASNLTKVNNPDLTENTKMTARYESGILTVSGLSKNDIGNNILLYDLQGRLIYWNKVTTEPQMVMSKNIRSGIYILRISGNKQRSVKLIVKR